MAQIIYSFEATRLLVRDWHSFSDEQGLSKNLPSIIKDILTPSVTESLPPAWQGPFSVDRARNWIRERDTEEGTLLIVEKESMIPLGLVFLFDMNEETNKVEL